MAISIICYTSERRDDGTYTILVNTTQPKKFPTKEDHAKRLADFGDTEAETGVYYVLWAAELKDKGKMLMVTNATKVARPDSNKPDAKVPETSQIKYSRLLSDSLINQITDTSIYPTHLSYEDKLQNTQN
jgi:hypothetical protein